MFAVWKLKICSLIKKVCTCYATFLTWFWESNRQQTKNIKHKKIKNIVYYNSRGKVIRFVILTKQYNSWISGKNL